MSALGMGMPPGGAPGGGGFPPSIQIGGGDQDSGSGADAPGGDGDPEQDLHDAIDALHQFMQDEMDHSDKAVIAKCIASIQGILGARQKGAESALGVTPAHKAMSRAYGA